VALAVLTGCGRPSPAPAAADARPELRISQRNEPGTLDPALATLTDDFFVIRALSEGLVTFEPGEAGQDGLPKTTSGPQPAAAASWSVSSDGLEWTFHLRPDGRWSNGEPVTADDFVASYRRLLTPATAAPKADLFFSVAGARAFATGARSDFASVGFRAAGPLTLIVRLAQPNPRFLAYVASGPWIPVNPRAVAQFGRDWTRPKHYVGNGPYRLATWEPHQRIVVVRNQLYAGAKRVKLGAIAFLAFDDGDTEERTFRSGGVDVTMAVPFSKLATYTREHPEELHRLPMAETRYLTFNTARPPLNDPRVRRALSLALSRSQLVRLGGYEPADRMVPPLLRDGADATPEVKSAPLPDGAPAAAGDPNPARQLLAAAGFPGGRAFPTLDLSTWARSDLLEAIQQQWRQVLGIQVTLTVREARVHLAALRSGRYDIGFMSAIPDVADAWNLLQNFTTGAPANYPHWSDPDYDAAVAQVARTDGPDRAEALAAAESRLAAAMPVAPLYYYTKHWLMRPAVQGWREDPLWTRYYLDLQLGPSTAQP
jgi:oligopeptide transport system substrate-binding protein